MATTTKTTAIPDYGSNIANFDANNKTHVALADAGMEYAKAKAAGDTAGMQAAAAKGQQIRDGAGGTTYDSTKGVTTFTPQEKVLGPVQTTAQATPQSYIDQLNNARLDATLAALGKSRDAALSNLNSEKGAIQPKYYDAKNQVAAGSQQAARNFAEYMAARGGTSSGANAQAELSRNMNLQGNLGSLGRQEAQAYTDIARRTTDLQNAYQSDVAGAKAGIESDRMSALLNQFNTDRQMELQLAQLMGTYNGQKTLAGQQQAYSQYADGRNYDYQVGRDAVADSRWKAEFDEDARRYGEQFAYTKARDKITDAREKARLDEEVRQFGIQAGIQRYNAETSRMSENRIGSQSSSSDPSTREVESMYISNIGKMSDSDITDLFKTQKDAIVADLGITGYNRLYNQYFDKDGKLKAR